MANEEYPSVVPYASKGTEVYESAFAGPEGRKLSSIAPKGMSQKAWDKLMGEHPEAAGLSAKALDFFLDLPMVRGTTPSEDYIYTGSPYGNVNVTEYISWLATPESKGGGSEWVETMPDYLRARITRSEPYSTLTPPKTITTPEGEMSPTDVWAFNLPKFGGTAPIAEAPHGTFAADWGASRRYREQMEEARKRYPFLTGGGTTGGKKGETTKDKRYRYSLFAPPAKWLTY